MIDPNIKPKRQGQSRRRYDRIDFISPYSIEECQRRIQKISMPLSFGGGLLMAELQSSTSDSTEFSLQWKSTMGSTKAAQGTLYRQANEQTHIVGEVFYTSQSVPPMMLFLIIFGGSLVFGVANGLSDGVINLNQLVAPFALIALLIWLLWRWNGAKTQQQIWELINEAIGPRYHYD